MYERGADGGGGGMGGIGGGGGGVKEDIDPFLSCVFGIVGAGSMHIARIH